MPPKSTIPVGTEEFELADCRLRRKLEEKPSPCIRDSYAWTHDPGSYDERYLEALIRVETAYKGCISCHALPECTEVADNLDPDSPEMTGIIAGRIVGCGTYTAVKIAERLGMPIQTMNYRRLSRNRGKK